MGLANTFTLRPQVEGPVQRIDMVRGKRVPSGLWLLGWNIQPASRVSDDSSQIPSRSVQAWGAYLAVRENPLDDYCAINTDRRIGVGQGGYMYLSGDIQVELVIPAGTIPNLASVVSANGLQADFPQYSVWAHPANSPGATQNPLIIQVVEFAIGVGGTMDFAVPPGTRSINAHTTGAATGWTAIAIKFTAGGGEVELNRWSGASFTATRNRLDIPNETGFIRFTSTVAIANVGLHFYGGDI